MKKYFEVRRILEPKGYSYIEMTKEGVYVIAMNSSGKVCLFDSNANPLDAQNNEISIEKDSNKENCYIIKINNYITEYSPQDKQILDS